MISLFSPKYLYISVYGVMFWRVKFTASGTRTYRIVYQNHTRQSRYVLLISSHIIIYRQILLRMLQLISLLIFFK